MRIKFSFKRVVGVVAVAVGLSVVTFAFTASNTVPDSKAGAGSGTITGYVVSSVHYNLDAADPQNIASVDFTLDAAPAAGSTIAIKLVNATNVWYSDCTPTGADVSCTTTGATVAAADGLTVVVAD